MEVTDCIRSKSEEVERKNCFDVEFNTLRLNRIHDNIRVIV